MNGNVHVVVEVGVIPFMKPGRSDSRDVMGERVARAALAAAGLP
ncbi:hypothetical protein ACFVZL_28330 [Streptomyces sp. NPDC058320]